MYSTVVAVVVVVVTVAADAAINPFGVVLDDAAAVVNVAVSFLFQKVGLFW